MPLITRNMIYTKNNPLRVVADYGDEIWKDVPGYEGRYQVSSEGNVKSLGRVVMRSDGKPYTHKECILEHRINCWGYHTVPLSIRDGANKQRRYMVHRLVAMAFVPNNNNYPQINHIDGNKGNNTPSNLEWCTNSMNQRHAWKLGLNHYTHKFDIAIMQYDLNGNFVKKWRSIHEAARSFGKKAEGHIWACLNGKRNKCMNYKWKYANDVQQN